jgi:hypothetical protein
MVDFSSWIQSPRLIKYSIQLHHWRGLKEKLILFFDGKNQDVYSEIWTLIFSIWLGNTQFLPKSG